MRDRFTASLNFGERLLVAAIVMIAMSGPIVIGLIYPPCGHAQSQPTPASEVASKCSMSGIVVDSVTGAPLGKADISLGSISTVLP